MSFEITRIDIWAGEIRDRRGAMADMLQAVLDAGANLDFIIARPSPVKPQTGILYLAPLAGDEQIAAAEGAGLAKSSHIDALRVTGPDQQGLALRVTRGLAEEGINISGFTAGRMGDRCVLYLRFEREADVEKASRVLHERLNA